MDAQSKRVFLHNEFGKLLVQHREQLDLPASFTTGQLISLLSEGGKLQRISLVAETGDEKLDRYVWGTASPYAVALTIRGDSYLTHASASFIHGITDQIPKTIYVNKEQSDKGSDGQLTQEGIDRAFKNKARVSRYAFLYEGYRIVLLSGKFTNRLEVSTMLFDGQPIDVTRLERTLIDLTVRPTYGGGPLQVAEAYRKAKSHISASTLLATYKKLNYTYPYHQAIGFYMEKAGYPDRDQDRFYRLERAFDFYLDYGMPNPAYSPRWKIHYPKSLDDLVPD